jgi:hypothetical protein
LALENPLQGNDNIIQTKQINGQMQGRTDGENDTDVMLMQQGVRTFKASDIDGMITGQTLIVPSQSSKRFIATSAYAELLSISGAGTPPTIRVGTPGGYVNVIAATALTSLTTQFAVLPLALISGILSIDVGANGISVDVSVAGLLYADYTIAVYLTGFYR